MNPALPLLLALSLGGLAVRRFASGALREAGLAWTVAGLAATLFLAPVLAIPDGIPSPAASLGVHVPWRAVDGLDPADGNPHLRDVGQQVQPWLLFLRNELRDGRLPFWNPHQFSGTPFWSNGSSAPLFPFHLLFAALPVQLGFLVLPWIRLTVGGCGAWALARELGCSRSASLAAAVVFPLSGMIAAFVLFPMANAHALVPWVLLATERLASGRSGWALLALLSGLQLMAGHPETAVFTGMLALVYLAVRGTGPGRGLAVWARFAGAWVVAGAISAVHTLPLALTLFRSSKWLAPHEAEAVPLPVLASLLLRLVLPDLHGNPALGTWWGPFNHPSTAIYAGAATLPLAAAALVGLRRGIDRERRWLAVGAFTLFALLAAYQVPGVRHLLGALPVVEKSLTHYLKFGVELGLALLAARGVDRLRAAEGRRSLALAAGGVVAALAAAWLAYAGPWRELGLLGTQAAWTVGVGAVVLLLGFGAGMPERHRRRLALGLPALLAVDLALAHARVNPALPASKLYPETGAVRFLEAASAGGLERLAGVGTALQPNASMVYGLYDVRGDTPVKLHHYQEAYASFAEPHPVYFRPIRSWRSPWLARLGVRWVMAPPGAPAPRPAWRLAYDGEDARVWQRRWVLPLVRWGEDEPDGAGLDVMERSPGRWLIAWDAEEPGKVVVAETWDPGWRAEVEGEPATVEAVDGVLLGVPVPAGAGHLSLVYRPQGLAWGAALTLAGLLACLAGAWPRPPGFASAGGQGSSRSRSISTGSSFQISRLYSAMVRSEEKRPLAAVLRMLDRLQASRSWK